MTKHLNYPTRAFYFSLLITLYDFNIRTDLQYAIRRQIAIVVKILKKNSI